MDTALPQKSPTQPAAPLATSSPQPVPVSDQPLTLDPNQMPAQQPLGVRISAQPPVPFQAPAISPIGGHKERAPLTQGLISEYIRPTEQVPQLPPEVAEAGVEVVADKEQPQLDDSHKAAGIEHAHPVIPVVIPQTTSIYLPYSPAQAKQVEKQSSTEESRHWLAQLTEYIIRKFQSISA